MPSAGCHALQASPRPVFPSAACDRPAWVALPRSTLAVFPREREACDRPTWVAPPRSTLAAFLRERAACAAAYFGAVHAQIPVFPARSARHAPRVSRAPSPHQRPACAGSASKAGRAKAHPNAAAQAESYPAGQPASPPRPFAYLPMPILPPPPHGAPGTGGTPSQPSPACGAMTLLARHPHACRRQRGRRRGHARRHIHRISRHLSHVHSFPPRPACPIPAPCTPRQSWPPA